MEIMVGIVVGIIISAVYIYFSKFDEESELINELSARRKENTNLTKDLENAETRATQFARNIKAVEDILINADKNRENYFITLEKIKELVKTSIQN